MTDSAFETAPRSGGTEGWARGTDRALVARLRKGDPPPTWEIDLHGFTADEARADLRDAVREAYDEGERCGLVIHGQGHGSEGGPVLRAGVPAWLSAPPIGRLVLAFTPARPAEGGVGATVVLLRRRRADRN